LLIFLQKNCNASYNAQRYICLFVLYRLNRFTSVEFSSLKKRLGFCFCFASYPISSTLKTLHLTLRFTSLKEACHCEKERSDPRLRGGKLRNHSKRLLRILLAKTEADCFASLATTSSFLTRWP
jgi:hypothetical protein